MPLAHLWAYHSCALLLHMPLAGVFRISELCITNSSFYLYTVKVNKTLNPPTGLNFTH